MLGSLPAWSSPQYLFSGDFSARYAQHLTSPQNDASNLYLVEASQKADFSDHWRAVIGGRGWTEAIYAQHPNRYPESVLQQDSEDLSFRDAYVQYQDDSLMVRLGNQQVVWGEAFGLFYSDIVNPKDLRDGGFGDFSEIRIPTTMANIKYIKDNFSLQGIFIPQPSFNLLPLPGSDFAIPVQNFIDVDSVQVNRQTGLPAEEGHEEIGGRVDYLWNSLDVSAFYFSYYDRNPYYTVDSQSVLPQKLILDEQHSRVQSTGLTATQDLGGGFMARFEGLITADQILPGIVGSSLTQNKTDDDIYVVGLDFPTWQRFNFGIQWSQDQLTQNIPGLLRSRDEALIGFHIQRPVYHDQSFDLIYILATQDGGQRLQLDYLLPLSSQLEVHFGVDNLAGPESSEFGELHRGSRAYVMLKSFFRG